MAQEIEPTIQDLIDNPEELKAFVAKLSDGSRLERQRTASSLSEIAAIDISVLAPYNKEIVDALSRPEARTRWECLDVLSQLVGFESRLCDKAIPGAEASLFDEDNGQVRLSSMKFLCKYGATTPTRSEKVWPLIDEGIQCYHGDVEFNDMLVALVEFSQGKLSKSVKSKLAERMAFDAQNSHGTLKRRAAQIIENLG